MPGALGAQEGSFVLFGALFGLLPLAIGLGAGADLQKPLALSVMGGLALSTPVTLLLVPGLYGLLQRRR